MGISDTQSPPSFWPISYGRIIVALYFFSGVTALAYEVLWARMLSLQFGVSIFGAIVTVAAFMLGLGVGSLLMTRCRFPKTGFPKILLLFAGLEASVSIFALLLPFIMATVDSLIIQYGSDSGLSVWYISQTVSVMLILFLPACALGATFPIVLRALADTPIYAGTVYGINSIGGALGAILPLFLLPIVGWTNSILLIAMVGGSVSVTAVTLYFLLRKTIPAKNSQVTLGVEHKQDKLVLSKDNTTTNLINTGRESAFDGNLLFRSYWAYAGIGLAALTLEISWTRLFGMILLRTEYVLAVILAIFLVGIASGSILARRLRNPVWLSIFPVLAALFALLSLWGLPALAEWSATTVFSSLVSALLTQTLAIAILTLPVTVIFGAWFPLLTTYLTQSAEISAAKLYGVNSVGAAIGTILSGFLLVPWLGSTGTICFAAGLLLLCGFVWVSKKERKFYIAGFIVLSLFALPVVDLPPVSDLLPVTQKNTRDLFRFEDAVSMTHVIERQDGQRLLLGDLQRLDASSEPSAVSSQLEQARLPLVLHPQPKSILFLGLGTGISAAGSLGYPGLDRTAVELSRGAIIAAEKYFTPVNLNVIQQMQIVRDDARRYLRRQYAQYDVIVGDLFHPDLVGRSALLSVQQFARVRARLKPQGLFVQWLALQQFDQQNLQVVLRTFQRIFPNAVLFLDGFKLAMVGPADEWAGADSVSRNMARLSEAEQIHVTGGEGKWTRLGRYFGTIEAHLKSSSGPVQDEWRPYIEFSLPQLRYKNDSDLVPLLIGLIDQRPTTSLAAATLNIARADFDSFERSYTATSLAVMSWVAGLRGDQQEAHRLIRFANTANPKDRLVALDLADKMYFSLPQALAAGISRRDALLRILEIHPDHEDATRALLRMAVQEGDSGDRYRERLQAISPLSKNDWNVGRSGK